RGSQRLPGLSYCARSEKGRSPGPRSGPITRPGTRGARPPMNRPPLAQLSGARHDLEMETPRRTHFQEDKLRAPRTLAGGPGLASPCPGPPERTMESFDQSLKYLLQHETAAFLRFGSGDPTITLIGPVPCDLPSRGRDVDGGYLIERGSARN